MYDNKEISYREEVIKVADIQAWFQPLLWIIATITALVAFVRLCKPVWKIFKAPEEAMKAIGNLSTQMGDHFDGVDKRLDSYDDRLTEIEHTLQRADAVQQALIHDSIAQICDLSRIQGKVSGDNYRRACELNKMNGTSSYIDTRMKELETLYLSQPDHE